MKDKATLLETDRPVNRNVTVTVPVQTGCQYGRQLNKKHNPQLLNCCVSLPTSTTTVVYQLCNNCVSFANKHSYSRVRNLSAWSTRLTLGKMGFCLQLLNVVRWCSV